MNIQQIVDELDNIVEQASNDSDISKNVVIEAITDLSRDIKGNDAFSYMPEDDDYYESFEEVDFSSLADMD
jgi:hypothetical protein|tara:strand:- start:385 stop:597 length:213 start_codon:yes stop_codon:yes gene_type:complete